MRYKALRNSGRGMPPFCEGHFVELDEAVAAPLLVQGLLELAPAMVKAVPPPVVKAVPETPPPEEGSVEKATDDLEKYRERSGRKHKSE